MSDSKPTSVYAGRSMTINEFADAREAVEMWASKTFARSNPKLYNDICHLCTLANGMWFNSRKEDR